MKKLFFLLVSGLIMFSPVMVTSQEEKVAPERTQVIDLDETAVIGEIEDPFILDIFVVKLGGLEEIETLNKSFLGAIKIIDKEEFSKKLHR